MKTISILIAICLIAVIGTEAGVNRKKKDVAAPELCFSTDSAGLTGDGDTGSPCPTTTAAPATPATPKTSGASIVNVSTPILVGVAAMISIVNSFKA